jgi:hypothetical protein
MNVYKNKQYILPKIPGLFLSIAYGFFIITIVQRHFLLGSGDIIAYADYFDSFLNWDEFLNRGHNIHYFSITMDTVIKGEGIFRYTVFLLRDLLNQDAVTILSYIGFIISSITFYICYTRIKSTKYLLYITPIFLIIFFTPRVFDLFASGIRSGIAFTIILVAIFYLKGAKRSILFGLACLIHLSMISIVLFYYLFYILENKRIKYIYIIYLLTLLLCSFFLIIVSSKFYVLKDISTSEFYNSLVFYLGLLITFTNKKVITNIYGFISVGLILIVLIGFIMDYSFIRYIGNSIIFYLMFLLTKGGVRTITVFNICYIPFFILTLYYTITNYY